MSTDSVSSLVYKIQMSIRALTHASPHSSRTSLRVCVCHFDVSHQCLDGISIARVVFSADSSIQNGFFIRNLNKIGIEFGKIVFSR